MAVTDTVWSAAPWWARWVSLDGLERPGGELDLEAVRWICDKAPNPNGKPLQWWLKELASDETWATRDWGYPVFWLTLARMSGDGSVPWRVASLATLEEVTVDLVLPAKLSFRWALGAADRRSPARRWWLSYVSHLAQMVGPRTRVTWSLRKPV